MMEAVILSLIRTSCIMPLLRSQMKRSIGVKSVLYSGATANGQACVHLFCEAAEPQLHGHVLTLHNTGCTQNNVGFKKIHPTKFFEEEQLHFVTGPQKKSLKERL